MTESFRDLDERLGWVYHADGNERIGAGRLDASTREINLELPLDDETAAKLGLDFQSNPLGQYEVPERLVFVDRHGWVGLDHCRYRTSTHHWGSDLTPWVQIRASYAVEIGARDEDYWSVSGVRSEVAGLARWSGLASVESSPKLDEDRLIIGLTVDAESQAATEIGTADGLSLKPYFSLRPSEANGEYMVTERVFVQTWVDQPIPWDMHLRTHQRVQDLLTLAYWWGCGQRVDAVCSAQYPLTLPGTEEAIGDKWREVIAVWKGRGSLATPMVLPDSRIPLFTFSDLGAEGVKRWVEESDKWVRVVGPLASSRFQQHHTIEVSVMQVGVSIEALGYQIARRQDLIQPGGKQSFPQYLDRIEETVDCDLSEVVKGSRDNGVESFATFKAWGCAFNEVYRQAKHADHPLPDPVRGWVFAEAGALLVRLWLAREFGVDRARLERNVRYQ